MPHLRYRDHAGNPAVFDLGDEAVIGRQSSCHIVISKSWVSRKHARIRRQGESWVVVDLGSSHGTFVNRTRVTERPLADGDVILIGDDSFVFSSAPAAASGSASVATSVSPFTQEITRSEAVEVPGVILAERAVAEGELVQASLRRDESSGAFRAAKKLGESSPLVVLLQLADELRRCADECEVSGAALKVAVTVSCASRGVLALREGGDFVPRYLDATGSDAAFRYSRNFVDKVIRDRVALLARDTDEDVSLMSLDSVAGKIRSIVCVPLWDGNDIRGYLYLDITDPLRRFRPDDLELATAVAHQAAAELARLELVDRRRREDARRRELARFLPPDVIGQLERGSVGSATLPTSAIEVREQPVSVLFADIQGFTRLAEKLDPKAIKAFLDDYLDQMTEILVDHHGGTLDKYMGDGILGLFGAPFSNGLKQDARAAVASAIAIRDRVESLRRKKDPRYTEVFVRIGVNTGPVVAGLLGSQRRTEYTVIGDAVNVASRLQSESEAGKILIGEPTHELVSDEFECRFAGERTLRNRKKPMKCWWVVKAKG